MKIRKGVKSGKSGDVKTRRRLVRWAYKGVIAGLCVWFIFFVTVLAMRRVAIAAIIDLTGAKVSVQSVKVALNGWVNIKGLLIGPHEHPGYDNTILSAKTVKAHFDVVSLLLLRPRVKEIIIRDFVLDAQYDLDRGRWNTSAIHARAPDTKGKNIPVVLLQRGTIRHINISKGQVSVVASIPVDARLEPAAKAEEGYEFSITTAERAYIGRSTLTGSWRRGNIIMTGGISSADVAAFERVWTVNVVAAELTYGQGGDYSLKLRMREVLSTHRAIDSPSVLDGGEFLGKVGAATALQGFFDRYRPTGHVDVELNASGNWGLPGESTFKCTVFCKGVTIRDRKFAYPIESIVGRVELDFEEKTIELKDMRGMHGDVVVKLNGRSRGAVGEQRYEFAVTSDNMALDNDLYSAMSGPQQELWSVFSPTGSAAIEYRVSKLSDAPMKRTVDVELLGVEAIYKSFPYPLKNLTGRLRFDQNSVTVDNVVSQFDGRRITLNGQVGSRRADGQPYELEIEAQDIPLDTTLAKALSQKQRTFYEQLSMTGQINAQIKILSGANDKDAEGFVATVHCRDTSLTLPRVQRDNQDANKPAIVISRISADAVITDDLIGIENFKGTYGEAAVSLNGRIEFAMRTCFVFCHQEQKV